MPRLAGMVMDLDPATRRADVYHLPPRPEDPVVTFDPVKKGSAIRFAVGRPGECSSVFRVWANRDKFDVYASIRTWKDLAKYSFHESGTYIYHLSSTEHAGAKWVTRPDPDNRRLHAWQRPEEFVPGWTHLITFMVPTEDVVPSPGAGWDGAGGVRWIAKPERTDTVTEFRVDLADTGMPRIDGGLPSYLLDAGIVDGFVLSNDQIVVVTMHVTRLDSKRGRWLRETRAECMAMVPDDFAMSRELGPRFACPYLQPDGRHVLWDISPPDSALTD
ncbi:hypothetical protein CNO18_09750 [Gordonia sp. 1D]|nr:hypothetical protein CNO18_09750 [Gordonia sp. 1D]